jgi:multiple antibiotic resistance protein
MSVFQLALTFFIVTNPIGNSPAILSLVKDYPFADQRRILLREGIISFFIAIFFQYLGGFFLSMLHIQDYAMTLCGGVLLLIIAFDMIFPKRDQNTDNALSKEPFIVPIATPLLSGAGVLSLIMLFAKEEAKPLKVSLAIIIAWTGVILVLGLAPYMQKLLGKRGLLALEQLMGMLLAIIATDVFVKGIKMFIGAI